MFQIQETQFNCVLPIWRDFLWPHRKSPIVATNTIAFGGDYAPQLSSARPYFFRAIEISTGETAGVTSCFATEYGGFRLRGTYVYPKYRGQGVARRLVHQVSQLSTVLGGDYVWTLARKSVFSAYRAYGFHQVSDWIHGKYEFGPNCFMRLDLQPNHYEMTLQYRFWNESYRRATHESLEMIEKSKFIKEQA